MLSSNVWLKMRPMLYGLGAVESDLWFLYLPFSLHHNCIDLFTATCMLFVILHVLDYLPDREQAKTT